MMEKLYVIKIGGGVIDHEEQLNNFLSDFNRLKGHKILVHGGGKIATKTAEQMGYQSILREGRRITDTNMLKVVTMIYGGLINKNMVSSLQALGTNAIGLTGADGNLIKAVKRPIVNDIDFGWVGDPTYVNVPLLKSLLDNGLVPIIAPLTHDDDGNILNTNADTLASVIASHLVESYEVDLVYGFEFPGVLEQIDDPTSIVSNVNEITYSGLKEQGIINQGMIPKMDNCFEALKAGVNSVKIMSYSQIHELGNLDFKQYTDVRL